MYGWRLGLACSLLGACSFTTKVDEQATVECAEDTDCPSGRVCVGDVHLCMVPGTSCIERVGTLYRTSADGAPCSGASIPDGAGICLGGSCAESTCGDGYTNLATEACDDGPLNDDDMPNACRTTCVLPTCGDGTPDSGEECDDGNAEDTDDCLPSCIAASCGDAVTWADHEACDDGNPSATDGCLPSCQLNACGDGRLNFGVETCEDFNDDPNDGCDACRTTHWQVTSYFGLGPDRGDPLDFVLDAGGARDLATDAFGNLYIAGSSVVWKLEAESGKVRRFAGGGALAMHDFVHASEMYMNVVSGVTTDRLGNVYIATSLNILRVDGLSELAVTVAGNDVGCMSGTCGDGGPALDAGFNTIRDVAVDDYGGLYITDRGIGRVRWVDPTSGNVSTIAYVDEPSSIVTDYTGSFVWFLEADSSANQHRLWQYTGLTGAEVLTGGSACPSPTSACGDGGDPGLAKFNMPVGLAMSPEGTLFVADSQDRRLRHLAQGTITSVAGTGNSCTTLDCDNEGPATSASFADVSAVAMAPEGVVYMLDNIRRRVYRLTPTGSGGFTVETALGSSTMSRVPDGVSNTAVPGYVSSLSIGVSGDGTLYVADDASHAVITAGTDGLARQLTSRRYGSCTASADPCGDGGAAKNAFASPDAGIATTTNGDVYFWDTTLLRIRRIKRSDGRIETVAGNGVACTAAPYDCGDGGSAANASFRMSSAGTHDYDLAVSDAGVIYVADGPAYRIRKVANGVVTTIAGDGTECASLGACGGGGSATDATLSWPVAIAVAKNGEVFFVDGVGADARVRKIDVAGTISTVVAAGVASRLLGLAIEHTGTTPSALITASPFSEVVYRLPLPYTDPQAITCDSACTGRDNDPADTVAIGEAHDVALGPDGSIYVAIYDGGVRRIDSAGRVRAALTSVDPVGNGSLAVARLTAPVQLTRAPGVSGWLVADGRRMQLVDEAAGRLRSVFGYTEASVSQPTLPRYYKELGAAGGIAYDGRATPRLWVSDAQRAELFTITLHDPADETSWVVSPEVGPMQLGEPSGIAVDAVRNRVYVADRQHHVLWAYTNGEWIVAAGTFGLPRRDVDLGDGKLAAVNAHFSSPEGILVDSRGRVIIADSGNHQVRRYDPGPVLEETVDDDDAHVDLLAGDGREGFAGDGAPARAFSIFEPRGVVADSFGNLYFSSGATVRQLLADAQGEVSGASELRTLYGAPPRDSLPSSATSCLSGIAMSPAEDEIVATDRCSGFFVHVTRTND